MPFVVEQWSLQILLTMRYAAAYVLATLAGDSAPDLSTIWKILSSVGVDCDKDKAQKVIEACRGKNVEQIIEQGLDKLSNLASAGASLASPSQATANVDAPSTSTKEQPNKEQSDEDDEDMVTTDENTFLSSLFSFFFFCLGLRLIRLTSTTINNRWIFSSILALFSFVSFFYLSEKKNKSPLGESFLSSLRARSSHSSSSSSCTISIGRSFSTKEVRWFVQEERSMRSKFVLDDFLGRSARHFPLCDLRQC